MKRKCACVVQGNIRKGTAEVLKELLYHFEHVILSTWRDEADLIPDGNFEIILSDKPKNHGLTHRNYQRVNTYAGIKYAKSLGCTHVLKWRTDMLPTKLDVNKLLQWSQYNVPTGVDSRIVTCAFRNLTVENDYFSSIPDLFSFGSIEMMELLWGDEGFDFSKDINIPEDMVDECGINLTEKCGSFFCPESELYAHFKSRLQKIVGKKLSHLQIAKEYMYLFDHERLRICWFSDTGGFRSIAQAFQHPWWTEKTWKDGTPHIVGIGYPEQYWWQPIRRWLTTWIIKHNITQQEKWYKVYRRT